MAVSSSEHPLQMHHPLPKHHQQQSMANEHTRDHRDHDVHGLRLALGSILSPKRLSTPSSRASSGTSSPCPAHFGPGLAHPFHPGPSHLHTPIEAHDQSESLKQSTANQEIPSSNERTTAPAAAEGPLRTRDRSQHTPPPILTTSNVHSLSPQQAQSVKDLQSSDVVARKQPQPPLAKHKRDGDERESIDHPRGLHAYIATLQSGRAWDALVHGNMS